MKIDRSELISKLIKFAQAGNGIIVGKPGVGKSYAIAEMRDTFKRSRIPHLILPVERLGDGSEQDVRLVLRRRGDFVDLLREAAEEADSNTSILIFDGFDAARGERQREGILKLIGRAASELADRWRVIVSVRIFDARKSARLLELFPPLGSEDGSDGIECRHIYVPPLTRDELQQAFEQYSPLQDIYERGSPELRTLLAIPFHLWLVEQSLRLGTSIAEFSAVTSEVQLLDMYWRRRVTSAADSDDRRYLLTAATNAMMQTHTLAVRRQTIYQPTTANAWTGLLSDEVLTEQPETELVTFSHNILFDFAVAVLLLQSEPVAFAEFISKEPARPLFLRPSLVYHFTRLWHFDRDQFWRNYWQATAASAIHLRQIIRIVLPAVVISEARTLSDLAPLELKLAQADPPAVDAVAFTIQALRVLRPGNFDPWAAFLRNLAPHLHKRFAWDAGVVVLGWLDNKSNALPENILAACGEFGRQLLAWAWSNRGDAAKTWFERVAGLLGIPIVTKTFSTRPEESLSLLRQVLSVVDETGFPIDCIWRLTQETEALISQAPEFVAEVYERVFGHEETSLEKTNMGTPVLGLISNRRQDYDGCEYNLIEAFPKFVAAAPTVAVVAGIQSLEAYARREHIDRYIKTGRSISDLQEHFMFLGSKAVYTSDLSAIWDQGRFPESELKLANAIFSWLRNRVEASDVAHINAFFGTFARTASFAFLWKRLLECGTQVPEPIGVAIWELACAKPILHGVEVRYALGAYLEKVSSKLPRDVRARIETAILEIPETAKKKDDPEALERCRNRLLGSIPPDALVTDGAITLRTKLDSEASVPPNEPPFEMTSRSRPYTEDEFLREKGAEPEKPENKKLRDFYSPLKNWGEKGHDANQIDALLLEARGLRSVLTTGVSADAPVVLAAWTHLGEFAAHAILETTGDQPRFRELKEMLLLLAAHDAPTADVEADAKWTSAVWSPAPRNSAAQALPWIAAFEADEAVLTAIETLAFDAVPSVRFLVVSELWRLGKRAPEVMWKILENLVANEANQVVLSAAARSLSYAWRFDKKRSLPLILSLLEKPHEHDENGLEFWQDTVRIVTDFAVWQNEVSVENLFRNWLESPLTHKAELAISGERLIEYIRPQQNRPSFDKARELLIKHLDSAARGLTELQQIAIEENKPPPPKSWRQLYGIIDEAVLRIYFAADVDPTLRQRSEYPLDDITRPKFFRDVLPILEKILSFGRLPEAGVLLAPTAHHFMQLLNGMLKYDPELVLHLAADVIESSKRYHYNLDGLAMKEVVTLVESLLADYREEIQDDRSITHLLNVLDAFVEAGWPDALNLVWRLDEVYR